MGEKKAADKTENPAKPNEDDVRAPVGVPPVWIAQSQQIWGRR